MGRDTLAGEVAEWLRTMVADGALAPGERVNEVRVAEALGVSRTPLREALHRLVRDGFMESRPRRGFFVQVMDVEAARELYQMRAILDPAALELAGVPGVERLRRLQLLNRRVLEARGEVEEVIDRDDTWHLELLDGCPNRLLVELIRQYMRRTRPLERAYLREHVHVERTVEEHARILHHLEAGDLRDAVEALRQNMRSGMGPILEWLERSPPTAAQMRARPGTEDSGDEEGT